MEHTCHAAHETHASHAGCSCCAPKKEQETKRQIFKIVLSVLCLILALTAEGTALRCVFSLLALFLCGAGVMRHAVKNVFSKNLLDEHFLMTVATIGAFCIGEFAEGAAVMIFYQIGELFQGISTAKSRNAISALMDICPAYANLLQNGEIVKTNPENVKVGDTILIKPGERIPVDCRVSEGTSDIDTKAITGESVLTAVSDGDILYSGSVNVNSALICEAVRAYEDSAAKRILALVEESSGRKSTYESFIHRFAVVYTPIVVALAAALAVIPSVLFGGAQEWIRRGLTFLVVSCPCALVLSVPLTFFGGLGRASAMGILIKGANYLEALNDCNTVIFDKTGTLTTGGFFVTGIAPNGVSEETLLQLAASCEQASNHPVSKAVIDAYCGALLSAEDLKALPGRGVSAVVEGKTVYAGNERLMKELGVVFSPQTVIGTVIHVAQDGVYLGAITVSDKTKDRAKQAVAALKKQGKHIVMLTGDVAQTARATAEELSIDDYHAGLLPRDKVEKTEQCMNGKTGTVLFVGDGLNDAPVMARADISVSMGILGSHAAIEASDIVLTDDNLEKLPKAFSLAKKTVAIARQNIVLALSVKALVLILGALGITGMWAAVFADVGVAVLAVLNAMRILHEKLTKL